MTQSPSTVSILIKKLKLSIYHCELIIRDCLRWFKAGSRHSRDNIFHKNTLSQDEKRPAVILLEMYSNCKKRPCLFNILSLKKQPPRAVSRKILSKFLNILKTDLYMNS